MQPFEKPCTNSTVKYFFAKLTVMKSILKLVLWLFIFCNFFSSCQKTKDWNSSQARLVTLFKHMNIIDTESAKISFTVDFHDEDNGERVTSFEWEVEYDGNKVLMEKKEKTDFEINPESGLPSATFEWSYLEILEKLGVEKGLSLIHI